MTTMTAASQSVMIVDGCSCKGGSITEKTTNQGFIRLGYLVRKQAEDERNNKATTFIHQPGGHRCEMLPVVIGGVDQNVIVWTR